jgi:hypothetical protein
MDYNNEPEQIVCNVKAMCDIAEIIYWRWTSILL